MLTQVWYTVIIFEVESSEFFEDTMTEELQQQISSLSPIDPGKSSIPAPLEVPTDVPDGSC